MATCRSCGYSEEACGPLDPNGFCHPCADARRDENDREAKVIRDRTWNEAIRRGPVHPKATPGPLVVPFEKVQEVLAMAWAEFTATEDFRNRMALAQEIELLNVEGGI